MPSIGEAFTQTVPALGTAGTAYASTINAILTEVMARLSTKVPVGSIAPAAADLDMNNQAVKLMAYAGFYDQGSAPAGAPYGRVVYAGDEFYVVTPSGTVKLTEGGAINVTSVGAIGGDYGGSNPALVEFVDSTDTYEFWEDGGGGVYALVKAAEFHVADQASGESIRIQPPSLGSTYDLILPEAGPGTGNVSLLAFKGSGIMQLAEDEAITEPFTADVRHGDVEMAMTLRGSAGGDSFIAIIGTPAFNTTGLYFGGASENVFTLDFPLPPIPVGRRLTGVKMRIDQPASSTATLTVYKVTDGGAPSSIGTANTTVVGSPQTVAVTGLTETVAFGEVFKIRVALTGGSAGQNRKLFALSYSYDYPAP